jgi:S1-C subfamily serine protease
VLEIAQGSPAHRLGFQRGDIVVSINEQNVATSKDLERATANANRMWQVTIIREGRQVSATFGG